MIGPDLADAIASSYPYRAVASARPTKDWCSIGDVTTSSTPSLPIACSTRTGVNFCAQAWYLGRRNVAREAEGAERLVEGTVAHRSIGARADRVRAIELVRRLLIVAMFGVATILLVQLFGAGRLVLPW